MTTLWTPEVLSGFIQSWYDGQDPNANNKASLPTVGNQFLTWRNKGDQQTPFSLQASDLDINFANQAGGTQYKDLYQPRFMGGSITKLSIVQGGDQMYSPSNFGTEKKLTAVSPATGSACYISYTSSGGAVTLVREHDIGPSYGYSVGDILEDASGGHSQGSTKATFRVDEVVDRGGIYFNETDSTTNFYKASGRSNTGSGGIGTECTLFIACTLYDDADDEEAMFKIFDVDGGGKDITIVYGHQAGMGGSTQYNRGIKYKNASNVAVVDPDGYSGDQYIEGRNEIFAVRMSATTAGKFTWYSRLATVGADLETMSFPASSGLSIMSDGATPSDVASTTSRGAVYEILIFNKVLDTEEVNKCVGYLNAKYSLNALQNTHPYANVWPDTSYVASDPINNDPAPAPPATPAPDPVQPADPAVPPAPPAPPAPINNPVPVPPAAEPTIAEITGSYYFGGAHRLNPRQPVQMVSLFLDFCDNEYGVNDGISTCTAAGGTGNECYNTKATCQDTANYNRSSDGVLQYNFTSEVGTTLPNQKAYPSVISVSTAPVEIRPTKGVSVRANVTIKLRDFYATGADVDPYFETRNLIALENGTYFQKLMQRNPHYVGRRVVVSDGYIDHTGVERFFGGQRFYIIDSMMLDNDVMTIKCRDPLSLADELKSKVPEPSRFSLNGALSKTGTHNTVPLRFNGITLVGSDSADKQKVIDYFGADNATGFVRIDEEIMGYTVDVSGSNAALDITSRFQWGTKPSDDDYEADDVVQKCFFAGAYDGSGAATSFNDVAYNLLVNEAGVPATAINNLPGGVYSWADERTNWLLTYRIDVILSEPKEVNKQLSDIGTMIGVNLFYEDKSQQIVLRAETPELDQNTILTITDEEIIEDSVKIINSEKERVSRVYYYYNMRDHVEDNDKPKNYKNLYIAIDSDSETADEYGKESNKVVFGYGIKSTSTATSVSQRLLSRFKDSPKTLSFKIDASRPVLSTGDHFFLSTKHLVDQNGSLKTREMQCTSIKFDNKGQFYLITAKEFNFGTINFAKITTDGVAAFSTGGGSGTTESPYTGVRKSDSFLSDLNHITLEVVNGGSGWTNGETLAFTPDEAAVGAAANTRNLTATYTQSGGVITAVTVTSNVAAGAMPSNVHIGYAATEILSASPNSSSGDDLKVRLTKGARMSGSQEPYNIV
jgi:hypothetical protein